ncbi:MAG: alpha/beta hydrolase [Planctomycetes bacterium]|nr:alpha/beta hydrolase [Planctomycetota bacterium]
MTREEDVARGNVRVRRRSRGFVAFKWLVRIGVLLFVVGIFIVGLDRLFYYPSKTVHYTPEDFSLKYEDVAFETSDGLKLSGWFLPADGPAKGTVIHFHGNAENITAHVTLSLWLVWEGYNVFVFDYRGYGKSEGKVTRAGTIRDGHAALDYVLSRGDVDPGRIFAFGQSLGGAVATVVAAERQEFRAVVLDSTFSGYRRIGSRHLQKLLFLKWPADLLAAALLSDDYDPIDYVARIAPRPLLVIASTEDEICFAELGRELHDGAGEPKEFVLVQESEHLQTVAENIDGVQGKILRLFERVATEAP